MAAVNPNYSIEIRVEDGTLNPGLGSRIEQVLRANGFENVTVSDKSDLGNYPTSTLTTDLGNLTTAYLVAGVLGLDLSAINVSDSGGSVTPETTDESAPTATAQPGPDGGAVGSPVGNVESVRLLPTPTGETTATQSAGTLVIVIGDDAPDPAYFTSEPFVEDAPIDDTAPVDESIEGEGAETGGSFDEAPVEE
jgi:hypothetical protein